MALRHFSRHLFDGRHHNNRRQQTRHLFYQHPI